MQKRSMTLDILCVNKYKIKTKIIEIVTDVRHGLQKPPLDVCYLINGIPRSVRSWCCG